MELEISYCHMKESNLSASKKVSTLALQERRKSLLRQFPDLKEVLRGSLVERYLTCGKPTCRCARGERHGPVWYLTATLKVGKTVGMQVPEGKLAQVRQWLDNHRKLKEGLEAISEINWELLRRAR